LFSPLGCAAVVQGLYVLRAVKDPETAKRLEESIGSMKTAAVVGIIVGGLTTMLRIFTSLGD